MIFISYFKSKIGFISVSKIQFLFFSPWQVFDILWGSPTVTFSVAHVQKDPVVEPLNSQKTLAVLPFSSANLTRPDKVLGPANLSLTQLTALIKCCLFSVRIASGYWTLGQIERALMEIHHHKWVREPVHLTTSWHFTIRLAHQFDRSVKSVGANCKINM